jgi:hypothetical protein
MKTLSICELFKKLLILCVVIMWWPFMCCVEHNIAELNFKPFTFKGFD